MFTDEFMTYLVENSKVEFDSGQLLEIKSCIECFTSEYNISKKSTELTTLDDYPYCYKVFCVSKKVEGMSERSLGTYNTHLRKFFQYVNKPVDKITTNDIRLFLYKRWEEISQVTLEHIRLILSSFFSWALDNEYITKNPMTGIKHIKFTKKNREALNEDELERLRDSCKSLRDKVIIEVLYSTGCRVSELTNIKISDVDFTNRTVKILGKGNKENIVFLNSKSLLCIKEYLQSRTDNVDILVYSTRKKHGLSVASIQEIVKRISKDANITKNCTPHVIRHTTATIALKRGMTIEEVSKMLGHSSIETTMIYAEVNNQRLKTDHEKYVV